MYVYSQDGQIVLLDIRSGRALRQIKLKNYHVRTACSVSSVISDQTSYLICVFNDSSLHVFNSNLEDIGQITLLNNDNELCQPQPCLTFQ